MKRLHLKDAIWDDKAVAGYCVYLCFLGLKDAWKKAAQEWAESMCVKPY